MSSALSTLALALAALAPSAHAQFGWAVTTDSELIHFELSSPSTAISSNTITGLRQADGVTADPFGNILDLAQHNGQLYGLDGYANFYSISSLTGAASFIGNSLAPSGFDAGLAYDPFAGKFRFVSDTGENKLIAFNGSVTSGSSLFYAPGDANAALTPAFSGVAIDYDFGTGFALDAVTNTLAVTFEPAFAEFFTVGNISFDFTALASMDMFNSTLYAALSSDSFTSSFYVVDSSTGAATLIGDFGTGITGLAVTEFSPIPEPSTYGIIAAAVAVGLIVARRRRSKL